MAGKKKKTVRKGRSKGKKKYYTGGYQA